MGEQLSRSKHTDTDVGKFDPDKYRMPEGDPITALVVGAGARGHGYSYYGVYWPNKLKVVGVCDPWEYHRNLEIERHKIPEENVFEDWQAAAEREKFADCVMICTPDRLHKDPAVAFAKKGYHILLEKPMAVTEDDCREIVRTCKENNVLLLVCHVLRYTPWVKEVKRIIDSGVIGDVVNINHTEPVGYFHFAHSFVRGNWHNEADSSSSLLAKCCHDVDLIHYWMAGNRCNRISSFGNLNHFHSKDKPPGAANRCLDCPVEVESKCPYSAKKIYITPVKTGRRLGWPMTAVTDIVDVENITAALRTGPYGRCVYDMDNDVMSHQVVNMQFEGGATATLQMVAFSKRLCAREVKIYGTKGEMTVDADRTPKIEVFDFLTEKTTTVYPEDTAPPGPLGGHGGADYHTVETFVDAVLDPEKANIETGPDDSLASHLLVFAAERARKENRVVTLKADGEFD